MVVKIGNIFESSAETLVNTVNCVGVMGKGIAKDFKEKYPEMYAEYVALCKREKVKPGEPFYHQDLRGVSIINFPTKNHWRSPSKLSYIISGLDWFRENYEDLNIKSIAFPPLGCGNGGLSWSVVGPLMYSKLNDLPIDIEIYAPYGTSPEHIKKEYLESNVIESTDEVVGSKSTKFNKYWLLILYVIQKLNQDRYSLNVGRTIFQKVCFVLTRVGIPTGFNFVEGYYGPYATEVKDAVLVLSNANLMSEKKLGKMVETIVSPDFRLDYNEFSQEDIYKAECAFDLLSRIKSTDQAEMIATVLFSYDELIIGGLLTVTEKQIFDHIIKWKPRWKKTREEEIINTIESLSILGWISPDSTFDTMGTDEDLY